MVPLNLLSPFRMLESPKQIDVIAQNPFYELPTILSVNDNFQSILANFYYMIHIQHSCIAHYMPWSVSLSVCPTNSMFCRKALINEAGFHTEATLSLFYIVL